MPTTPSGAAGSGGDWEREPPPPRGHRLGRTQFPRSMGGVHFDVNITNLVISEPDTAGLRANLGLPVPDGRFGPLLSDKAATQQL